MPDATPPQTVGPFFSIGLPWPDGPAVAEPGAEGAIVLRGAVYDGEGAPVPDALIETWQTDPARRPAASGAARPTATGAGRSSRASRRRPAERRRTSPSRCSRAGCCTASRRGSTSATSPQANAADPLLSGLDPDRRATLIAAAGDGGYRFDIHLQGDHETAFFRL